MTGTYLYGGDYNPEQWLNRPDILEKDVEMLKRAGCNTVTMGMFSWSTLEPEEGKYNIGWLRDIVDNLYAQGIYTVLGTPSGARPKWLANAYPEVLRVNANRERDLFGHRHNHCYTSPAYREKVAAINNRLAEEFADHPAVILWHLSNEYGGECHCDLCQQAFRDWLKTQYTDIAEINQKWWSTFWSHTYGSFDDIESPSPRGETEMHGLVLAWKRFVTAQTLDFMRHEAAHLHLDAHPKPITTNMMYRFEPLNYFKFADFVDIVSWDSYPPWHKRPLPETATDVAFWHDVMRSLKKKPFLLMESCPSATNWQPVSKLKRPGMLELSSLQAVAHGSDSVQYFQIRQSRGSSEKFHGALIDQYGGTDTRVYKEATETGDALLAIRETQGSNTKAKVAIIYDWENKWALEAARGPRNEGLFYRENTLKSYAAFRKLGLDVDILDMEQDISDYAIVAAPMLYMLRAGFEEKIRDYVEKGGNFVLGAWSGIVDADDLCFLEGTPHGLTDVFGLRREEIDALYDGEYNIAESDDDKTYRCEHFCDLVRPSTAQTVLHYAQDFYECYPAYTENVFGKGKAFYVCADMEQAFYDDAYAALAEEAGLDILPEKMRIPGLEITRRASDSGEYIFVQNFTEQPQPVSALLKGSEILYGAEKKGALAAGKTLVLKRG